MTNYPDTITEGLSFGPENKQYRFVIKFDKKVKTFADTQ